uniref:Uncharacterized protein n=1 Tax=Musca domestica TaxID=7370 RepID=A0A1I8NJR6_MUSDO
MIFSHFAVALLFTAVCVSKPNLSHQSPSSDQWLVATNHFGYPFLVLNRSYQHDECILACYELNTKNTNTEYEIMLLTPANEYSTDRYYVEQVSNKLVYMPDQTFVCASPLQGAIVWYTNGSTKYFDVYDIPILCHPQLKQERHDLAGCILIHRFDYNKIPIAI